MIKKYYFKDIVTQRDGFLRGPFGGDLKKEIFVEKGPETYKVYEQGVVLNSDKNIGRYYISKKHYDEKLKKFTVQDKDFLVSCSGMNMGAIYQIKTPFERGIINQALLRIRLNNEIVDDNYFYYLFKELISKKITSGSGDSTIPNFPGLVVIKKIEFELPDKHIQEKVGRILYQLDSKIEINDLIKSKLETMAKTIYNYWFLQFDFPNDVGKPFKSNGCKMVWSKELKREIPDGWQVKKLKQIATIIMGQSPQSHSYNKEKNGTPLINGAADYNNGLLVPEIFTTEPTRVCEKDDLVFCIRATIGNLTFAEDSYCLGRGVAAVRPNDLDLNELIYFNLLWEIERFKKQATGSIIIGITKDDLTDSLFLLPPENILKRFHENISPIFSKLRSLNRENQELTVLRNWLLPMLMNGQVEVK
jgi:type I restriction enzyme, S subunit